MTRKTPDKPTARVTMKDVALRAGVSQSTVSFVLNGMEDMRISEETRRRVMRAVQELGYRARGAGRPRKSNGYRMIGMILDEIATSPFAAISIEGVQEEAWKNGILVEVAMTRGDKQYEAELLRRWSEENALGVIYSSILTREVALPDLLRRHRAVLLNCYDQAGEVTSVVPAERRGGELATKALIDEGYRRIAFISGEPWMEASDQRMEGYERALRAARIPVDPSLIVEGNFMPSGGRDATLRLMAMDAPPDAIFCANDLTAIGCYEGLKELGLRPGGSVAVMGYDDQEIAQHLSPPLSTVVLPHREMGQLCVSVLSGQEHKPEQHRIECPLALRASHRGE
ncbi:LacI family DNA-binding transcriptional regulator [Pontivivens insulae]|uniref:Ribose operon repressor n=1 Tax=Pontivivens insulae TaxID=1639689 RepID=A0A2R8AEJ6_9RHOB|nr:LacI family DNA-binding transcriptional regulator [Pontivivens insulae]RED14440.1 LacI family transcriptional regulator [Pontivivens insulae]SPF30518.1 Ribose operon repressor [Pontivivens insulae]